MKFVLFLFLAAGRRFFVPVSRPTALAPAVRADAFGPLGAPGTWQSAPQAAAAMPAFAPPPAQTAGALHPGLLVATAAGLGAAWLSRRVATAVVSSGHVELSAQQGSEGVERA